MCVQVSTIILYFGVYIHKHMEDTIDKNDILIFAHYVTKLRRIHTYTRSSHHGEVDKHNKPCGVLLWHNCFAETASWSIALPYEHSVWAHVKSAEFCKLGAKRRDSTAGVRALPKMCKSCFSRQKRAQVVQGRLQAYATSMFWLFLGLSAARCHTYWPSNR